MATAAPQVHNRTLMGILFMCLASSLFPVMNGLVQVLSAALPLRAAGVGAGGLAPGVHPGAVQPRTSASSPLVRTTQLRWQVLRSVVLLTSTFLFFNGVKHLELAKAASISFTSPFMVALIAWPMLGERMTLGRLAAVVGGVHGRADRHPAGQRRVPLGLAADRRQLRLLRALPGGDAPRRRPRPAGDLGRLQRARRHAGHDRC